MKVYVNETSRDITDSTFAYLEHFWGFTNLLQGSMLNTVDFEKSNTQKPRPKTFRSANIHSITNMDS